MPVIAPAAARRLAAKMLRMPPSPACERCQHRPVAHYVVGEKVEALCTLCAQPPLGHDYREPILRELALAGGTEADLRERIRLGGPLRAGLHDLEDAGLAAARGDRWEATALGLRLLEMRAGGAW